ncbi:MAG: FAD-binding oxidoreductase [Alphaproteobacteria bacterium]
MAGTAAGLALSFVPQRSRAQSQPSEAAWRELGQNITGGVIRPNDPRFVRLTLPENLRYYNPPAQPGGGPPDPDAPLGLVRPQKLEEVAYAIKWARQNNLPMVPRSGGHSYAGCSTVRGLVISSSAMQSVSIEDGQVVAGGGALFGHLLAGLRDTKAGSETGRYTVTHGRCAGVGLSAYLMGGGLALDSPHAGMGCDRVTGVEMVLADGTPITASDKEKAELLWAVRGGGGGNLGFVTKWRLKPLPVDKVVAFSGTWRLSGNAHDIFGTLFRALDAAPDRMGSEITLSTTAGTIHSPWRYEIKLVCQLHGSREEFDTILGAAVAAADRAEARDCWFNDCSSRDLLELPYWGAQEFFEIIGSPNRYQETSVYAREVSDDFIGAIFGVWPSWPGTVSAARLSAYRLGGQVNTLPSDAMAYVHRSARWLVSTDIDWSGGDSPQVVDDNLKWQRDVHNHFSAMLGNRGSYYNFPDPGLENHARAYWGTNLERLAAIKRQVDPDCVFTPPRNQWIVPPRP